MPKSGSAKHHWDSKYILSYALFTIVYFAWYVFLVGTNAMTFAFFAIVTLLFFVSPKTRKIFYVFLPFFIYLVLYDSLRILHDYNIFTIHNKDLYDLEVAWFGIELNGTKATMNEYFQFHQNKFMDLMSGIFYISWVPFPLAFTIYLIFKKRYYLAFNFWLAFLITNLLGFIIYITLPAAPPWYYLEYGAQINLDTVGQSAGLARFDEMIGFGLYETMYSQSSNVFGALPSMHAAFPLLLTVYSLRYKNYWFTALFALSMLSIWIGAVYTSHHYILDILLGILCGVFGYLITEYWLKNSHSERFLGRHIKRFQV